MNSDYDKYNEIAELLKTVAHPVRICMIRGLLKKGECNVTYMQSCLGTPQSTVSQHIQKLKAAGIIEGRRSGLEIYYKVKDEKVTALIKLFCEDED